MKKFHQLFIFYIIVLIVTFFVINILDVKEIMSIINYFMGISFMSLGLLKLFSLREFVNHHKKYDILSKKCFPYSYIYPFIEIGFGVWFLFFYENIYVYFLVLIVLLINFISNIIVIKNKNNLQCACISSKFLFNFDKYLLLENIIMLLMILYMLTMFLPQGNLENNIVPHNMNM